MKKDIHPEYSAEAKTTCACGATYSFGSTKKEINVEICASCHPFYTGLEKTLDAAGRVEKFRARKEASGKTTKSAKKK